MAESTVHLARESPVRRNGQKPAMTDEARLEELKTRLANRLNRLSLELMAQLAQRMTPGATEEESPRRRKENPLQARVKLLGQLAAGLAIAPAETLPSEGAGYGSSVAVEDTETGERSKYLLMIGALVDIDANQVSLASPIGQALLGRSPGDLVTVELPLRERRLRILEVTTLDATLTTMEMLQE